MNSSGAADAIPAISEPHTSDTDKNRRVANPYTDDRMTTAKATTGTSALLKGEGHSCPVADCNTAWLVDVSRSITPTITNSSTATNSRPCR